jgi:formylglycine-generating enzyme required for sulfatase activity/predicted Ser/Thr protein kinase
MGRKKTVKRAKTLRRKETIKITFPVVGEVLEDRFELRAKLGEGAFSVSFKAFDKQSETYKTLKVYGLYAEVFPQISEIRSEARIYAEFRSPHFPILNKLHESTYIFLELEYIEGDDLYTLLRKHMSKTDKIDYAIQLADTLFYLHSRQIEHLDLKPENIIIDKHKKLYLIDFGTAVLQRKVDITRDLEGTFQYCPAETLRREEKKYQRDIFAFGIILYEMIYGKYPYEIDAEGKVVYTIPKPLHSSKKPIDKILKKCLQYYPEERYQSFLEIIDDFDVKVKTEGAIFRTLARQIVKKTPIRDLTENFKRDLKHLYASLLTMLILLPIFLFFKNNHVVIDHDVYIDAPTSAIYVNGEYAGYPPMTRKLRKGDVVAFMDEYDRADFEMTYGRQKRIVVRYHSGNKVSLNNKVRGMILRQDDEIPSSVRFVSIRSDINPRLLDRPINKITHIGMTPTAPRHLFTHLPASTTNLNLRGYIDYVPLLNLRHLTRLRSLDLGHAQDIDAEDIPAFPNLERLNLQNTRTRDIGSVSRLRKLKHLNLRDNNVTDISALSATPALMSVNLTGNPRLTDLSPIANLKNMQSVRIETADLYQSEARIINAIVDQQQFESNKRLIAQMRLHSQLEDAINFMIFLLLLAISIQFIRLMLKRSTISYTRFYPQVAQSAPKEIIVPKERTELQNFRTLDQAISDHRYYYPERNNALYFLHGLLNKYPQDTQLLQRKEELKQILNEKIKIHLKRKEYEPVYLATSELNHYFPHKKHFADFKKSEKPLLKKSPIKWIFVKEGTFDMGDFQRHSQLVHEVSVNGFKMTDTPITNEQFCRFLNSQGNKNEGGQLWIKIDSVYSRIGYVDGEYYYRDPYGSFPVYEVSWWGAQRYCEWEGGRLPTEAEWEYAARSRGLHHQWATGNEISKDTSNYLVDQDDNFWKSVYPVKSFPPNKIGLYEMSGNILEWCFDWYHKDYYKDGLKDNPRGPKISDTKVVRGGAWCFSKDQARTFYRGAAKPATRNNYIGFRAVLPE